MEDQINTNHKTDFSSMSVKDLFFKYFRFLPLFLLTVAISLFIAYAYLRYSTPIYRSGGTLMIKNDNNIDRNDKFENIFMPGGTQNVQSEIEVLKSKPLMERVVNALNLRVNYFAVGKIKKSVNIYKQAPFVLDVFEIIDSSRTFNLNVKFINNNEFHINNEKTVFTFGQLFKNDYGTFRLERKTGQVPSKEYTILWQSAGLAAGGYASSIEVTPKSVGTGILNIAMETTNPDLAADVINQLMIEYQNASIEEKKQTAKQTILFIDDRLALLNKELDSVQRILLQYQQNNDLIDLEAQSAMYFAKIGETDKQIMEQTVRESVATMLQEYLTNKKNNFELVPSSLGLEDITLNALIEGYNKLQQMRKDYLDANVPPGNIVIKNINDQIEKTRRDLLENLNNIQSALSMQINNLKSKSKTVQNQVKSLPAKTKEWLEIKRDVETKQELYKILMEKREETAISQASTISNSKVIDKAVPVTAPIKPNRRTIQIMAILIGLGLPALIIFILEVTNDKITTRYDIERITQAPVLGEIGHSFSHETLIVEKASRGMVSEQFRIIRSNLQYILNKIEKPVLLVTSSFSGEGKSFVSTNLGAVMALAGKRTIILEFDIRKPKILSGLKLAKKPGITNFLLGKADLASLPNPVPGHENLFVMGCGPVPPNPAELLLDSKVADLFEYLKNNFDVIMIDTAPVGMVSDAMTLSRFADATLYIVRQGHTYKKQVGLIDEFYREGKLPKISIIINDVKIQPGYGYYGYGRYGYGYGYTSGYYEEEAKPPSIFKRWRHRLKKWNGASRQKSSV
jgi:tyrosine-protein kinase Etk/Wzc